MRFKNEWVWILSKTPEISEKHLEEAKRAIDQKVKKYDFDRLVEVEQSCS